MKNQIDNNKFYEIMIPDSESNLYKLLNLNRSMLSLLKYLLFKGGISNAIKGQKLYTKKFGTYGYKDRIEAGF